MQIDRAAAPGTSVSLVALFYVGLGDSRALAHMTAFPFSRKGCPAELYKGILHVGAHPFKVLCVWASEELESQARSRHLTN